MENINLAAGYGEKKNQVVLNPGMRWIIGATVFLALLYVGLLAIKYYLDSSNQGLSSQYQSERQSFMNQDAAKVLDFQNRMLLSKDLSVRQRDTVMDLRALEGLVMPGVYVNSYDYEEDGKSISVKCTANDYDTVAKQILSFGSSSYFKLADAGKTSLDSETRKISFDVLLDINQ